MSGKKLGFCGWFFSMVLEERLPLVCLFLLGQVIRLTTLQYQMPVCETSRTRWKWWAPVPGERANA